MIKNISIEKLSSWCFLLGAMFSFVPFLVQLLMSNAPNENSHVFTFFANQIILNGKLSLLNALLSILGAALIGYGVFSLNGILQKKSNDSLLNFATYLFVISTIGFIFSWSQDFIIVWGDVKYATNHMMVEFSLIFSFGLLYWLGISIFTYQLSIAKYIHENFLKGVSYIGIINVLLIIYTLFTFDPYNGTTITPLYMGFVFGNFLFLAFCILVGKKLLMD